jgi:hypothetical protein
LKLRPWWIRRADYATLFYPQELALASPTSGGRSVGIVSSRIQAMEFSFLYDRKYFTSKENHAVLMVFRA